jgi:hypothetical protein
MPSYNHPKYTDVRRRLSKYVTNGCKHVKYVIFEPSKKKYLFFDISSTNAHRFTSASKPAAQDVFWLLSQPLPQLRFKFFVISETFATQL